MTDYNHWREAALLLFSMAIFLETWVNWEMFLDKIGELPIPSLLKWTTCACFILFSAVNIWAFFEVKENPALGKAVVTKMLYSGGGLFVMTCLHFWARHMKKVFAEMSARIAELESKLESKK